jgi:hypothetical protein
MTIRLMGGLGVALIIVALVATYLPICGLGRV